MEQRMTLISDKTDEFPNNANNSFKVRIPNGLRLEGTGWHVALLSLTLPNSSTDDNPFATGYGNTVAGATWTALHFRTPGYRRKYNAVDTHGFITNINANNVASTVDGVGFWNNLVQFFESSVMESVYVKTAQLRSSRDPTPVIFVKQSMCPSFRWDGEDLVVERRGADSTNGNTLYSSFDIAMEVAVQWGLARQQSNGSWVPGPNLRHTLFDDAITTSDPNREDSVTVGGIASLNGKAIRTHLRTDVPRAPRTPTPGVTIHNTYKQLWHYTFGNTQWIRLSGFAEWRLTNLNRTYDVLHRHSGKAVMVYTNLQQSTIVGNSRAQLLRELVIHRGGEAGHSYSEPNHLQWVPVSTHQTDIVEVQLADVDGNLLALPKGKSLVAVALKQMV